MAKLAISLGLIAVLVGVACVGDRRTDEEIGVIAGAVVATAIATLPTLTPQPTATPFALPPTAIDEAKMSGIEAVTRLRAFFDDEMMDRMSIREQLKKALAAKDCDPALSPLGCAPNDMDYWMSAVDELNRYAGLALGNYEKFEPTYQGKGTWSFTIETVRGRETWFFFESGAVPFGGP